MRAVWFGFLRVIACSSLKARRTSPNTAWGWPTLCTIVPVLGQQPRENIKRKGQMPHMLCNRQMWDVLLQSYEKGLQSQRIFVLTLWSDFDWVGFIVKVTIRRTAFRSHTCRRKLRQKCSSQDWQGAAGKPIWKPRFGAWKPNRLPPPRHSNNEDGKSPSLSIARGGAGMSSCRSFAAYVSHGPRAGALTLQAITLVKLYLEGNRVSMIQMLPF